MREADSTGDMIGGACIARARGDHDGVGKSGSGSAAVSDGMRPQSQVAADSPLEGWREIDSNLYGAFCVKWSFWFFVGSLFGAGRPFFVPSPAIRFPQRAEGVKGPKR